MAFENRTITAVSVLLPEQVGPGEKDLPMRGRFRLIFLSKINTGFSLNLSLHLCILSIFGASAAMTFYRAKKQLVKCSQLLIFCMRTGGQLVSTQKTQSCKDRRSLIGSVLPCPII